MQNQSNVYQQLFEKLLYSDIKGENEAALVNLIKTGKVTIDRTMCTHICANSHLKELFERMVSVVDPAMIPVIFTEVIDHGLVEKLETLLQMGQILDREQLLEIVNKRANPNPDLVTAILKKRD